jgi:hypothetical protein
LKGNIDVNAAKLGDKAFEKVLTENMFYIVAVIGGESPYGGGVNTQSPFTEFQKRGL